MLPLDGYHASIETGLVGPDWQYNAVKVIEAADFNYHIGSKVFPKARERQQYGYYGDFKYAGRHLNMGVQNGDGSSNSSVSVDLLTGLIIDAGGTADFTLGEGISVTPQSNGYWRVAFNVTTDADAEVQPNIALIGTPGGVDGSLFYLGDGVSGVLCANLHFHRMGI
jgi:hypothetical protein